MNPKDIFLLVIFTAIGVTWSGKFNSSGPFSFDYMLAESSNFSTKASVVFLDYEIGSRVIANLKNQGKTVICYVSVGSYEEWRPDASKFPKSVIGKNYSGWPGENWLDVRQVKVLLPLMQARFDVAAKKGCEGIDPDNMDVYSNDSGFKISKAQQIAYNKEILKAVRSTQDMMAGLKNGGSQAKDLVSSADFVVSEQCQQYTECSDFDVFLKAKPKSKPVFVIEYTETWSAKKFRDDVCPLVNSTGRAYILKKRDLKNDYTIACI